MGYDDLTTAETEFKGIIDYKMDDDDQIAIRIDIMKKYTTQQTNILRNILCVIIIIIYKHNGNTVNQINYKCIIWIITTATNFCAYKLDININSDNKLKENRIIWHKLNTSIIIAFMIKGYEKFDANMNTLNHIYQMLQKLNYFDFIITTINTQMTKLPDEAYLSTVTHGKRQQNVASVFMLLYVVKIDDFDFIIALINATDIG